MRLLACSIVTVGIPYTARSGWRVTANVCNWNNWKGIRWLSWCNSVFLLRYIHTSSASQCCQELFLSASASIQVSCRLLVLALYPRRLRDRTGEEKVINTHLGISAHVPIPHSSWRPNLWHIRCNRTLSSQQRGDVDLPTGRVSIVQLTRRALIMEILVVIVHMWRLVSQNNTSHIGCLCPPVI